MIDFDGPDEEEERQHTHTHQDAYLGEGAHSGGSQVAWLKIDPRLYSRSGPRYLTLTGTAESRPAGAIY